MPATSKARHPVWDVYDEWRTIRLNRLYYSTLLMRAHRVNRACELITAGTSSTAVASIWLFDSAAGRVVWRFFGSIAAVVSLYTAIWKPSDRVRDLESRVTAYRGLDLDLERLAQRIRDGGAYTPTLREQFGLILDRRIEVAKSYTDPGVHHALRSECQRRVIKELPDDRFFVPPP